MSVSKCHGGLGFNQIYPQGIALLARWASQLLVGVHFEWTQLFYANLASLKWETPRIIHSQNYSLIDKLLLYQPKTFGYCLYTKGMWLSWATLCKLLLYSLLGAFIPSCWTIQHFLSSFTLMQGLLPQQQSQITTIFVKLGITTIKDLWDLHQVRWKSFSSCMHCILELLPWLHDNVMALLLMTLQAEGIIDNITIDFHN